MAAIRPIYRLKSSALQRLRSASKKTFTPNYCREYRPYARNYDTLRRSIFIGVPAATYIWCNYFRDPKKEPVEDIVTRYWKKAVEYFNGDALEKWEALLRHAERKRERYLAAKAIKAKEEYRPLYLGNIVKQVAERDAMTFPVEENGDTDLLIP